MAGNVHIPWYATALRADKFVEALAEVTPKAVRYGSTGWTVQRSQDDHYKILQTVAFESHEDWEKFWYGPEMTKFRAVTSGWFQVPVQYTWHDVFLEGSGPNANGNGGH